MSPSPTTRRQGRPSPPRPQRDPRWPPSRPTARAHPPTTPGPSQWARTVSPFRRHRRQASALRRTSTGRARQAGAYNNAGRIHREYGAKNCTNFVSKAMYYGGRMKMRTGWYSSDKVWWRNPTFSWVPKNSHTWSAAENLRRHFDYRQKYYITQTYNLRAGDILLFRWQGASRYDHAAVATGNNQGAVRIAQHGYSAHDALSSVISRNRADRTPIASIIAIRPVGA
ncbi:amidase domain-containing protein [Streptomyces erythrochromogenes]|uniref:amidase domain-containing protein n=1 Tax=Streptomyces erythrochromogenes TaxID=285574 RepID=UPI003699A497